MVFSPNAATVYADGPGSSPAQPEKSQIRALLTQYEAAIDAYSSGAGSIAKSTRALLYADLAHAADVMAWVYADGTASYNGIYRKIGASGSGSWDKILALPYAFSVAEDSGAGTANAIQVTSVVPSFDGAVYCFSLFESTTGSPVTVSINGGAALTLKTNRGSNASALTAGMDVWGRVRTSDSTFRLLNDQDVSALVAQAEAARDEAVAAAASVNLPILASGDGGRMLTVKSDLSGYETQTIERIHPSAAWVVSAFYRPKVAPDLITTGGFYAPGDRGGATYKKVSSEPSHPGKLYITLSDASTAWYELVCDCANVRQFGAWGDGNSRLLSSLFGSSLGAAQRLLPSASALTQQVNDVAINAAIAYAAAKQQTFYGFGPFGSPFPVYLPEGGYYLTSITSIDKSVRINGAGQYTSMLMFAGSGGVPIGVNDNDTIEMYDLGLIPLIPNAGTALSLSGDSGPDFRNSAHINRVAILSWDANYFNKAVFMQHICGGNFENIEIRGSSHWYEAAFDIGTRCIDNHFRRCDIAGAQDAWLISGDECEGVRIEDCSAAAVNWGVRKTSVADVRPHFAVRGTHIAANRGCVQLTKAASVFLTDNLFYLTDQAGVPTQNNDVCAYINQCSDVFVDNTKFGGQNDSIVQYGLFFQSCLDISVDAPNFAYFDYGIVVSSDTTNGSIRYPTGFNVGTLITNNSSSVIVKTT
jgi:hypothetical protein